MHICVCVDVWGRCVLNLSESICFPLPVEIDYVFHSFSSHWFFPSITRFVLPTQGQLEDCFQPPVSSPTHHALLRVWPSAAVHLCIICAVWWLCVHVWKLRKKRVVFFFSFSFLFCVCCSICSFSHQVSTCVCVCVCVPRWWKSSQPAVNLSFESVLKEKEIERERKSLRLTRLILKCKDFFFIIEST